MSLRIRSAALQRFLFYQPKTDHDSIFYMLYLRVALRVAEGYLKIMESEQFRESIWNIMPYFGTSKDLDRADDFLQTKGSFYKSGFFNLFLDTDS